jgi:hypothetical protein
MKGSNGQGTGMDGTKMELSIYHLIGHMSCGRRLEKVATFHPVLIVLGGGEVILDHIGIQAF